MKKVIVFLFLMASLVSFSQSKTNTFKPSFRIISSGGIAIGQKNISSVFQVIPGIRMQRFYTGIGLGFDDYRFRSLPLFADVRYHFGKRDFGFIYADAGYNFPFDVSKSTQTFKTTDIYTGGFYGDFGAGFRFLSLGRHSFLFSAGYSIKHITNKIGYTYTWTVPPAEETFDFYSYSMQRIVAKLSWQFGSK